MAVNLCLLCLPSRDAQGVQTIAAAGHHGGRCLVSLPVPAHVVQAVAMVDALTVVPVLLALGSGHRGPSLVTH